MLQSQAERAPDAKDRALRDSERCGEAPTAPARTGGRSLVQGLGEHGLHQRGADRARGTRAGVVREALHTVREAARAPFADGLRGELEPSCALTIRPPGVATEHDTG